MEIESSLLDGLLTTCSQLAAFNELGQRPNGDVEMNSAQVDGPPSFDGLTSRLWNLNEIQKRLQQLQNGSHIANALKSIRSRRAALRKQLEPVAPVAYFHRHPEILDMIFAHTDESEHGEIETLLKVCKLWKLVAVKHMGGRLFSRANWEDWSEELLMERVGYATRHGHRGELGPLSLARFRTSPNFRKLVEDSGSNWIALQIGRQRDDHIQLQIDDVVAVQDILASSPMPRLSELCLRLEGINPQGFNVINAFAPGLKKLKLSHALLMEGKAPWLSLGQAQIKGSFSGGSRAAPWDTLSRCSSAHELTLTFSSPGTKDPLPESIAFSNLTRLELNIVGNISFPPLVDSLYFPLVRLLSIRLDSQTCLKDSKRWLFISRGLPELIDLRVTFEPSELLDVISLLTPGKDRSYPIIFPRLRKLVLKSTSPKTLAVNTLPYVSAFESLVRRRDGSATSSYAHRLQAIGFAGVPLLPNVITKIEKANNGIRVLEDWTSWTPAPPENRPQPQAQAQVKSELDSQPESQPQHQPPPAQATPKPRAPPQSQPQPQAQTQTRPEPKAHPVIQSQVGGAAGGSVSLKVAATGIAFGSSAVNPGAPPPTASPFNVRSFATVGASANGHAPSTPFGGPSSFGKAAAPGSFAAQFSAFSTPSASFGQPQVPRTAAQQPAPGTYAQASSSSASKPPGPFGQFK